MNIHIETQPRPNGYLAIVTFDENRKPIDKVFVGLRHIVARERTRRIDYWCEHADEVTANALPTPRQ